MTLVVGATTSEGIWLMTDRRLTFATPMPPRDNAMKVFELGATDGVLLVGYAGLGLTVGGVEPSEWMARTVRNLRLTVAQGMQVLSEAMQKHLAPHIQSLAWQKGVASHAVLGLALVDHKPRTYEVLLYRDPNTSKVKFLGRWMHDDRAAVAPVHIFAGGSGARYIRHRELRQIFKECVRKRLTPRAVAARLAAINLEIHQRESTVGTRCIVTHKTKEGGGQSFYFTGLSEERNGEMIPAILRGNDMRALLGDTMQKMLQQRQASSIAAVQALKEGNREKAIEIWRNASSDFDLVASIKENIQKMPRGPDPSLK